MSSRQWPEIAKAIGAIRDLEGRLDAKQDAMDELHDRMDGLREEVGYLREKNVALVAQIEAMKAGRSV